MRWDVGKPLPGRRARRRLSHLLSGHAGGAIDAQAGEARRGGPEHHRGADEGGRRLQGCPGKTGDGGRGRGDYGTADGRGNGPPGGRREGGGAAGPGSPGGGRGHERRQSLLVTAAQWAATLLGRRWYRRRTLSSVLASEQAFPPVLARPVASPGSAVRPEC
jgi:hypothetical protein